MATPHLQLATIYHNYKLNYIAAIYHYDRYLELRPDAEKTDFINDQKLKVAQALANTLINNSPEVKKVVQERNQLIKENQDLKRQLANALSGQKPVVESTPSQTATATIPKSAKPVEKQSASAVSGTHQVYHVVGGDTLTKIATRFYGDSSKWDVIFEANKDTMRSAGDLKVGQTIIIPALGN
jgi:nucleoid-associated protein YgaU